MRKFKIILFAAAVLLAGAQIIQPDRSNPPVDHAVSFETVVKPPGAVAGVLARSCRDCHSHDTVWPWYSSIAPASWLVGRDVKEGRAHLNLSRWDIYSPEMSGKRIRAMCEAMKEGEMPPKYYTPLHPQARLHGDDVAAVCTLAGSITATDSN